MLSGGSYSDGAQPDEISGFEQYFNQTPNDKLNLDINMLFLSGMLLEEASEGEVPGRLGRLALLRLAGRGMDRYTTIFSGWSDDENGAVDVPGYPEPNVTVHKSYEYYTYAEDTDERLGMSLTTTARLLRSQHVQPWSKSSMNTISWWVMNSSSPECLKQDIDTKSRTEKIPNWIAVRIRPSIRLPTANFLYN